VQVVAAVVVAVNMALRVLAELLANILAQTLRGLRVQDSQGVKAHIIQVGMSPVVAVVE
jgi:hypothetical protein